MFEQRAMFVLQMTLLLQRWNVVSLWTVYSRVCTCIHVRVWVPDWCILMVLMHAVAEHWGVTLLSATWKSVRELGVLPDTFSTWGKKEGMDRFFLCWQGFYFPLRVHSLHQHEGGRVLVCPLCESPHRWVRTVSQSSSAAVHATFYLVLEFPMSFMPYRVMYYMYLQERAGQLSIDVWMCIIATWNCLYNKIKRESTKYTKRRGKRRQSEG